jgi:hypothetical protein
LSTSENKNPHLENRRTRPDDGIPITAVWIASALGVVAIGFLPLFTISLSPGEISWLLLHPRVRYLVEALIAIVVIISVVLPVGIVIWK